jgi:chaperone required for assembly of F1-ATPase
MSKDTPDLASRIRAHASSPALKRFYEAVTVTEDPGGFGIALDRRPLRTPARAPLLLPSRALAEAIAEEWAAQGKHVVPASMVLTRLANTALDRVAGREREVAAEIVAYAGCDLLCYRAEAPVRLVERQTAAWDPPLAWAAKRLGSHFVCQTCLAHQPQPPAVLATLRREVEGQGPFRLAALHTITTLTGSAILGFAVLDGHLSPDAAWSAAHIDEDWQIEQWGSDGEAQARRAARAHEFDCAVRLLGFL